MSTLSHLRRCKHHALEMVVLLRNFDLGKYEVPIVDAELSGSSKVRNDGDPAPKGIDASDTI